MLSTDSKASTERICHTWQHTPSTSSEKEYYSVICQRLADVGGPQEEVGSSQETMTITLQPDIILWFTVEKKGFTELTVPWKEGMVTAHKRKHLKYPELAVECQEAE